MRRRDTRETGPILAVSVHQLLTHVTHTCSKSVRHQERTNLMELAVEPQTWQFRLAVAL